MADAPVWMQTLSYRLVSAAFHQPRLLRLLATVVRNSKKRSSTARIAANVEAVRDVLAREASFSHGYYPSVMIDGAFLIGQRSGQAHASKRACLHALLPTPQEVAQATVKVLPKLRDAAQQRVDSRNTFDLIEDYMAPLVWQAIRLAYGAGAFCATLDRELLLAARWVGAQLMIGSFATADVLQRALRSAAVLDAKFGRERPNFKAGWASCGSSESERIRDAIGLMWVGHPATTQAGALIVQELLTRPAEYKRLRQEMQKAGGPNAIGTAHWRAALRNHVLELLRFRPPFPLLGRLVPRQAAFVRDHNGRIGEVLPGRMSVLTIGALFDPAAQREDPDAYVPCRHFYCNDDRYLMFGAGPRDCIAREQVIEILITALGGLLAIDGGQRPLRAPRWKSPRAYDGPLIVAMPLRI